MAEFIRYDLRGNIKLKTKLDLTQHSCHGQKTRITTKDGHQYIGYMDYNGPFQPGTIAPAETHAVFALNRFDIDPLTKNVRSYNFTTIFVPLTLITKVEAILYSNPRWGRYPNNDFSFHVDMDKLKKARLEIAHIFEKAKRESKLKKLK